MKTNKAIASALGVITLAAPAHHGPRCEPKHRTQMPPVVQPASQPSSRPVVLSGELSEGMVYRLTQKEQYAAAIADAAERWGLSPFNLAGLLMTESRMQPGVMSKKTGAAGIAQFVRSGAAAVGRLQRLRGVRDVFTYAKALDPVAAIHAAAELLAYLRDVCRGVGLGVEVAFSAYNTGSCRAYVPRFVSTVVKHANRLRMISGLPSIKVPTFNRRAKPRRVTRQAPNS